MDAHTLNANTVFGVNEPYENICPYVSNIRLDQGAAFFAARADGDGGFPLDGRVEVNGIPFKLASGSDPAKAYDGNDSIVLKVPGILPFLNFESVEEHTLNLETIGVYDELHILATAAGPGTERWMKFEVVLHYNDGTNESVFFNLYDWYDIYKEAVRCEEFSRVYGDHWSYRDGNKDAANAEECIVDGCDTFVVQKGCDGPNLFVLSVNPDQSKLLKAVTFKLAGVLDDNGDADLGELEFGLYGGVYAITGSVNAAAPDAPVATPATGATGDSFLANWTGVTGATGYVLDVAEDEEFKRLLPGYANKDVENVTSFEVAGVDRSKTLYYRVRAVNENGQSLSSNVIALESKTALSGGDLPQTGDHSQLYLWLALCLFSLAACAASKRARHAGHQ